VDDFAAAGSEGVSLAVSVICVGQPVPGEGVFALAGDSSARALFGIVHPSGRFFAHDIAGGRTRVFADTAPSKRTLASLRDYAASVEDVLARRLAVDQSGRVYGSMPVNKLFRFEPKTETVEVLADEIILGQDRAVKDHKKGGSREGDKKEREKIEQKRDEMTKNKYWVT
jgi:hypothetical protein